jgi:hypothetical protein
MVSYDTKMMVGIYVTGLSFTEVKEKVQALINIKYNNRSNVEDYLLERLQERVHEDSEITELKRLGILLDK